MLQPPSANNTFFLLGETALEAPIAWWRKRLISRAEFLGHVDYIARRLPEKAYMINLCEDRYLFMTAFAATLQVGKTNLLPLNRLPLEIANTLRRYPNACCLTDSEETPWPDAHLIRPPTRISPTGDVPRIAAHQPAAVVFTSGSTGQPEAHIKTWRSLNVGARLARQRFELSNHSMVATVPQQHMYGLETSIMLPLVSSVYCDSGRPFFPEDIRQALARLPPPRCLITTPLHLSACVRANLKWPSLARIISATAPLSENLAAQAEAALGAEIWEIYGCTETGSLATRRILNETAWRLFEGLGLSGRDDDFFVAGGHLDNAVKLPDLLHPVLEKENEFHLLGRQADLVNIAGKRVLLSDLSHKLTQIDGVLDGVIFMPETPEHSQNRDHQVIRPTALAVAPDLEPQRILDELARRVDPVFLPRPLYKVERLPRNPAGKLPRADLLALLAKLEEKQG